MPQENSYAIPIQDLRWRLDTATLSFETTKDLQPLRDIIGQERGVAAFQFGIGMDKPGYNVFVTGLKPIRPPTKKAGYEKIYRSG